MASGSVNNGASGVSLTLSWSSTAGTGGSTVNANLIAKNASNVYMSAHVYGGYSLTINGTSKSGSGAALSGSYGGSVTLLSNSVWVAYTGNKSITISGSANFSGITISGVGTLGNQTVSTNAALDKVGSAPTLTKITAPTTQVVSETTSSITVTWEKATSYNNACTYAIGVSINGGAYSYVYPDNNIDTTSYTYTVPNKTQGTTYKFSVVAANDVAQSNVIESGTVTLNKLEPPTISDIATYNPYVTSALSVSLSGGSQLNSDAFYRCAALYYGDTQLVSVIPSSTNNTSVSLTYSTANYLTQLGTKKYSDTFKVVAWSQNSNGSKSTTVSKEFTVNINSDGGATPTLGAPTLSGGAFNNASTCFIKGVSTLTVTSATGSARRAPSGTTLSYSIGISGSYSQSGSSASWSDLSVGTKTITVTCTDSRGLSTSVTKQCVIQDYKLPTITVLSVARLDSPNTSAKAVYTINYTSIYQYTDVNTKGNQLNGVNSQQYRLNGGTWTNYTSGTAITGLSTDTLYKFELRCTDKVKTSTYCQTQVYTIPTIKHEMSLRKGRLGINCVPQSGYALDVAGKGRFTTGIESSVNTSSYLSGSKGTNVLVNSTATGADYKTFLSGASTNGRFSLSMYQDRVMVGYQAQSSIDEGTNALTKYINLLNESGNTSLNGLSANSLSVSGASTLNGSLEVSGVSTLNNDLIVNRVIERTTEIPSYADLSTTAYLKVGQYSCGNNYNASTLTNSPTIYAFKMFVINNLGYAYDNESQALIYRFRILIDIERRIWVQVVSSTSTGGSFTYNPWRRILDDNNYKDLTAFTYSTTEQWTGKYDSNGRKIYSMDMGGYDATNKTGSLITFTKTFGSEIQDVWFDMQMSNICIQVNDGSLEFKPISSPSPTSTYSIESVCWLQSDRKTLKIKNIFGSSFSQYSHKYVHPYILYTYK